MLYDMFEILQFILYLVLLYFFWGSAKKNDVAGMVKSGIMAIIILQGIYN